MGVVCICTLHIKTLEYVLWYPRYVKRPAVEFLPRPRRPEALWITGSGRGRLKRITSSPALTCAVLNRQYRGTLSTM